MHRIPAACAVATLALFVSLNLALALHRGVCFGDDAFFAVVAKNLAWGHGYSSSLGFAHDAYVLEPFDAHITTGPTLLLPASAAILVLGNRPWVPGVVQVAVWTVLLAALWRAAARLSSAPRAATAGVVFLLVSYAVSCLHLEEWYAMLGEVPAALLVLLGVVVWSVDPTSRRRSFLAAVVCASAVLTKLIAALYVLPWVALAAGTAAHGCRSWRVRARALAPVALGLALPFIAFSLWEAFSIGFSGCLSQLHQLGQMLLRHGLHRGGIRGSLAVLSAASVLARLAAFHQRFGFSLPGLLAVSAVGAALVWRAAGGVHRRLSLLLLTGVVAHVAYWLVFSLPWDRYLFVGVLVLAALSSAPYLFLRRSLPAVAYSGALALTLAGTVPHLRAPWTQAGGGWARTAQEVAGRARVVAYLDQRLDRRPFATQWWAPVAEIEYLSRGVLLFEGYKAATPQDLSRGMLVVTNQRFFPTTDEMDDRRFSALIAGCGRPTLQADPYAVYDCGGPRPQGTAR